MTAKAASPQGLAQNEAFARIRLLRSPHIGGATYLQLLARCGDAASALASLPDLASRGEGKRPYRAASEAAITAEIAAVKRAGARYIFHDSADYPPLLRQSEGAPPILIARGATVTVSGEESSNVMTVPMPSASALFTANVVVDPPVTPDVN